MEAWIHMNINQGLLSSAHQLLGTLSVRNLVGVKVGLQALKYGVKGSAFGNN
jgi:hypothetical protein